MEISVIESSSEPSVPLKQSRKQKLEKACKQLRPFLRCSFTKLFAFLLVYGTLWGVLEQHALPGSNVFAITLLVFASHVGGEVASLVKMPPLLGMLLVGFLYRNLPFVPYSYDISPKWAATFRNAALVVIMIRAGLCLDPAILKRLSAACIRLSFFPCSIEAIAIGFVSYYLLHIPLALSFALGFVVAAVSPAVVVPSMLLLEEKGYGINKGIPTLIVAATAIENVYAITVFGICIGIAFAKGNLAWTVIKGPLAVVVGLTYGAVIGVLCWHFPHNSQPRKYLYRVIILTFAGLAVTFISQVLDFAAAGALGCLGVSFVAALKWREEEDRNAFVADVENGIWKILETFLFSLIGVEVSVRDIQKDTGYSILILFIGLTFRLIVTFLSVIRSGLTIKENIFVPVAWIPKATVQAAIGSVVLDLARNGGLDENYVDYGKQILTIAVLSILLTAPLGAVLIAVLGPLFLHKTETLCPGNAPEENTATSPKSYGTLDDKNPKNNNTTVIPS